MRFVVVMVFLLAVCCTCPALAGWVAYNDPVLTTSTANVTNYSGRLVGGGGIETTSGLLKDYATGAWTGVTATLSSMNVAFCPGGASIVGTDAYNTFNGIVNTAQSATYNLPLDWYYDVTFTGLDPTKTYDFVTTANANSLSYNGIGTNSRWTKFSITGADSYTNSSSTGVRVVSDSTVIFNTGYNTVNGYVAKWTGIVALDGSFTVRSQNVGFIALGEAYKSYGLQGFMLAETSAVPEPSCIVVLLGGLGLLRLRRRR